MQPTQSDSPLEEPTEEYDILFVDFVCDDSFFELFDNDEAVFEITSVKEIAFLVPVTP